MPHSTHSYNPPVIRKKKESPRPLHSTHFITYTIILYILIATLHYVACFPPVLGVLGRYIILYIYIIIYMTILLLYTHAYIRSYIYIYINVILLYMVFFFIYTNHEYGRARIDDVSALRIGEHT